MENENQTKEALTENKTDSNPDLQEVIEAAIERVLNKKTTDIVDSYQTKLAEALQKSQARLITPNTVDVTVEPDTLKFVKDTLAVDNDTRQLYGQSKLHMEDDLMKMKIICLKKSFPNMTAEQIHSELYND